MWGWSRPWGRGGYGKVGGQSLREVRSLGQKSPPMLTPAGVLRNNFIKNHWGEGEEELGDWD